MTSAHIGSIVTINADGRRVIGTVYAVEHNGWLRVETTSGVHAIGPRTH